MALSQRTLTRIKENKQKIANGTLRNATADRTPAGTAASDIAGSSGSSLSPATLRRIRENKKKLQDGSLRYSPVDNDYINEFFSDVNAYYQDARKNFGNLSYSTAKTENYDGHISDLKAAETNLRSKAKTIQDYMYRHKNQFDDKTYESISSYLSEASGTSLSTQFSNALDAYSRYETEEDYNAALKISREYGNSSYSDIRTVLDYVEKGYKQMSDTEYSWLSAYGDSIMTPEDCDKEIADLKEDIRSLTKYSESDDLYSLAVFYNNYSANPGIGAEAYGLSQEEFDRMVAESNSVIGRFGSFSGIQKEIGEKKQRLKDVENRKKYGYLRQNEDYARLSVITPTTSNGQRILENWDWMTTEEVADYNYLYHAKGWEAADAYLDYIQEDRNLREAAHLFEDIQGQTGLELLYAGWAGVEQFFSGIGGIFSDEDIPTSTTQYLSGYIREDLADATIPWYNIKTGKWEDQKAGAFLRGTYDVINTTANMAPSILTSIAIGALNPTAGAVVGNTLLGASAAGNAYQEKLSLGYSKDEAMTYGIMVGASEALLQYALGGISKLGKNALSSTVLNGLDDLDNIFTKVANTTGGKILMNASSEALEEGLQAIIEPYLWSITSGEEFTVDMQEVLYSSLLGFITGGVFEAAGTDTGSSQSSSDISKRLRQKGFSAQRANAIADALAASLSGSELTARQQKYLRFADVDPRIRETMRELAMGSGSTAAAANASVGADLVSARTADGAQTGTQPGSTEQQKAVSERNTANTGNAKQIASDALNSQNQDDIARKLERNGFTKQRAKAVAEALVASANGLELTPQQQKYLRFADVDQRIQQAVSEGINNSTVKTETDSLQPDNMQQLLNQANKIVGERNLSRNEKRALKKLQAQEDVLQFLQEQQIHFQQRLDSARHTGAEETKSIQSRLEKLSSDIRITEEKLRDITTSSAIASVTQKANAALVKQGKNQVTGEYIPKTSELQDLGNEPVNIELKYMKKWTTEQKKQVDQKLEKLSQSYTVKTKVKRSSVSAAKRYREVYGKTSIPAGYDVDHTIDLQLGGADDTINMELLDMSVNRSLGAQLKKALKKHPIGTVIGKITISERR